MHTLAIANQKGGVGKTTTALNVGAALAAMGKRVLLVDLDPSGDLTISAGIELTDDNQTIYEVLTNNVHIENSVIHVHREHTGAQYDIVPADGALADLGDTLHGATDAQTRLRNALQSVKDKYDYVLIDTPPSVSLQTVNALVASDAVIVPAMPHYLSLAAVNAVSQTVNEVKAAGLNKDLDIAGVVLTNYNGRAVHHRDVKDAIDTALPNKTFNTTISNGIAVTEAAANGTDIFEYVAVTPQRRYSKGAQQYQALAEEIEGRING